MAYVIRHSSVSEEACQEDFGHRTGIESSMAEFSYFASVYDTTLVLETYKKVIADPVKVEFFKGGERHAFTAHIAPNRIVAAGVGSQVAFFPTLHLDPTRYYIALTARSAATEVRHASAECETAIDRCVSDLAIIYSPYIFNFPVYRGFIVGDGEARGAAYVRLEALVTLDAYQLERDKLPALRVHRNKSTLIDDRYGLMSRFFAKALSYEPSEEKFLFLWTVLEIYPMVGTTDIRSHQRILGWHPSASVRQGEGAAWDREVVWFEVGTSPQRQA